MELDERGDRELKTGDPYSPLYFLMKETELGENMERKDIWTLELFRSVNQI